MRKITKISGRRFENIDLTSKDVVIGIAASGKTPYVIGGLTFANTIGATTVSISCNEHAVISEIAQYPVEVKVGPEVLTGSTRLKSGTAQKLILNMISTITMVGVGKVYDNLMIDVKATNQNRSTVQCVLFKKYVLSHMMKQWRYIRYLSMM